MLPDDYENLSQSVVATNFFGNNILAAITTKNYWDVVNEYKPLMHTWYVGVVMQFYLIYPLLFFIAKSDKRHTNRTLLTIIALLAVFSLLFYFMTTDAAARFYYLPTRFYEFAFGGIVAIVWKPEEHNRPIPQWLSYLSYVLILALMAFNSDFPPANIRLVLVVGLSTLLVMSSSVLENRITGNGVLAKVGAASYSIFVWHQVLLAFYRYTYKSQFTFADYSLFLLLVALLSFLSYIFIEQKTNEWLKDKTCKVIFCSTVVLLWIGLTGYAAYIYKKGGVVRDVPELYISKDDRVDHKVYNDKIYQLDKPFETKKRHWLVVGNSFGRDFANVILESSIADSIELSYIYIKDINISEKEKRFKTADKVFISTFSSIVIDEEQIKRVENLCLKNGLTDNLIFVGTKNFGESNGQFYKNRFRKDYFEQRTKMEEGYANLNELLKSRYGSRYLDIIGLVIDENGSVPVFTPDHHFISQDCRHFSKGGAVYFAQLIDWNKYLE